MEFILTAKGTELQAKIQSGKKLVFTKAESAEGYSVNPKDLTALTDIKQGNLSLHVEVVESNIAEIQIYINNIGITERYMLKQIGIYALDPDTNEEILYIIGQDSSGDLIHLDSEQLDELRYKVKIQISDSKNATIHVNCMNIVTQDILEGELSKLNTILDKKADKVHGHMIHDINNILFEIKDNSSASVGKYTRIMESVLINKANSGAYARYQVQFDYSDYFEIDITIQQDKLLTEEIPKICVSSYNCPNWVRVYVTVQSDPDWQIYDIDLYLKINKQFDKMKLRELVQNGNTSVLTHYDAYKVIDKLEDRQNLVKIIEATKYVVLSIEEKEAMQNIQLTDTRIDITDENNHFESDKLDGVLDELFQFASNSKLAITTVAGLANNSTFQVIANELTEWKRLVAEAGGISAANENMRTQAAKIVEYVRTHLPTIITTNGGSLVNSTGAGVTAVTSTLDTIYHSINNLAVVKNNQINAVTNEKNQLVANYNDMVNQKNSWYQNYVNMEADRNNWMNVANGKKESIRLVLPLITLSLTLALNNRITSLNSYILLIGNRGINYQTSVHAISSTFQVSELAPLPEHSYSGGPCQNGISEFHGYALIGGGRGKDLYPYTETCAYDVNFTQLKLAPLIDNRKDPPAEKTTNLAIFSNSDSNYKVDAFNSSLTRIALADKYGGGGVKTTSFLGNAIYISSNTKILRIYNDSGTCSDITDVASGCVGSTDTYMITADSTKINIFNTNFVKIMDTANTYTNGVSIQVHNELVFSNGVSYDNNLVMSIIPKDPRGTGYLGAARIENRGVFIGNSANITVYEK